MVQVPIHRSIRRDVSPLRDDFTFEPNSDRQISGNAISRSTPSGFGPDPDAVLPSIEIPLPGRDTPDLRLPSLTPSLSNPADDRTRARDMADRRRDVAGNDPDIWSEGSPFSTAEPAMMDMTAISAALPNAIAGRSHASMPLPIAAPQGSINPSPTRRARRNVLHSQNASRKYVVEDEAPSDDKFNCPAVQNSLRDTMRLMAELVDILGSSTVHKAPDSVMQRLHRQAQNLVSFERPSTRTVGFVGDSGTGKSSLINSLLDFWDLAGSSGEGACTCVATEFRYHANRRLAITVERFSEKEIIQQVKSLLRDYRAFHCNTDRDAHDAEDLEERAKLAQDTFEAMFHGSFVHKGTLLESTEKMAIGTLKSWVREFGGSAVAEEHFDLSRDEGSSLLMESASGISKDSGAAYPWIKKIKVYLNAHILKNGLVLVDLPGLHDLNAARRNITERYILECDRIFVVANVDRAITNQGVPAIFQLAQKAQLSNIGIVCTKIDDIEASYLLKKHKGHKIAQVIQTHLDEIENENSEIKKLQQEISIYEDDVADLGELDEEETQELARLNKRLRSTT